MNKRELIEHVASFHKITKAKAENILSDLFDTIKTKVKQGDDVKIVGFGTFTKNKRKGRSGRNPHTGEAIEIPAAWFPKFRAGFEFKELIK